LSNIRTAGFVIDQRCSELCVFNKASGGTKTVCLFNWSKNRRRLEDRLFEKRAVST